jgi:hypothetical protein
MNMILRNLSLVANSIDESDSRQQHLTAPRRARDASARDFFAGRACDGRAQGLVLLIRTGTMRPQNRPR